MGEMMKGGGTRCRWIAGIVCIAVLWMVWPVYTPTRTGAVDPAPGPTVRYTLTGEASRVVAQGLLLGGLRELASEIDLSTACLPRRELGEIFSRVMDATPELFYVENRLSYTYGEDELVLTVRPAYSMEGEELAEARRLWDETLAEVRERLAEARSATGPDGAPVAWGEADTVLFLHEYLADTYAYDTDARNYDALRLFRDGVGVCQAYALAFLALARDAGLEAELVTSRAMDHAWNHVRVDGVWYHVDVTRDDPIREEGATPLVYHDRLLRSDAGMAALGYHDYTCAGGHICPDARFETSDGGSVFEHIHLPLVSRGNGWFAPGEGADEGLWIPVCIPAARSETAEAPDTELVPGDMDRDGQLTPADLLCLCAWWPLEAAETDPEILHRRGKLRDRILGNH